MIKKVIFGILIILSCFIVTSCGKKEEAKKENSKEESKEEVKEISIVDLNSNTRPIAITINNFPKAVKVESGLAEAYLIYEIPVEGGISRSLAFYKDKYPTRIGTVRSARHNMIDYALENDAILAHFGWSHYAQDQINQLNIDHIDGNSSDPSPFWRENPENLAHEHTAYGNLSKIRDRATEKGYRMTSDVKPVLNYTTDIVDLSTYENHLVSNNVTIPYSGYFKVEFKYNSEDQRYYRYVNGVAHTDYYTKEHFSTKNIIVVRLSYSYTDDNHYLDLHNIGTGDGYYITNGYAIPITWYKESKATKTIYKDNSGNEIKMNDGNTYIMIQSNSLDTIIE